MPPKLLLADDSETVQRVIELTFADENVQVVSVSDGLQAIERIKTDRPDIVLADVEMPERNGYEVAAFVKGDPSLVSIPVLLLAAPFEPIDEGRARAIGCDGVLVKPFEPQMVVNRVRELLRTRSSTAPRSGETTAPHVTNNASPPAQPTIVPDRPADYLDRLEAAFEAQKSGPQMAATTEPDLRPLPEAFAALLAAEQGRPIAPAAATPPALSDAAIDDIARRVIVRMGNESMRRAVLDVAERLVREEIERIKRNSPANRR